MLNCGTGAAEVIGAMDIAWMTLSVRRLLDRKPNRTKTMNPFRKFFNRRLKWEIQLKDMAWFDRLFCCTWSHTLHQQTFHQRTDFNVPAVPDPRPRWVRVNRVNMKSNGPECTTKRWWFYTRWGAFYIDLDSCLFT